MRVNRRLAYDIREYNISSCWKLDGSCYWAFYGYLVSVNGGLHRLNDSEYVRTMQSINAVIQNPLFFVSFLGPSIVSPLATFLQRDTNSMQFTLLLASSTYTLQVHLVLQ